MQVMILRYRKGWGSLMPPRVLFEMKGIVGELEMSWLEVLEGLDKMGLWLEE
jgi:hypothetical protein